MERSPKDYCLRQILKMGHYLSMVRQVELLSIEANFYKDSNGKIWFCHASNILTRPKNKNTSEP